MAGSNEWKRRNLDIIKYGTEKGVIQAGPAEERQALSDWDRLAKAGEACTYFIHGQRLSDIQPKGFETVDELRDFFKQHLFPEASNADQLATSAMAHFHQAGLPHATNFSIKNISMSNKTMQIRDPETVVNFESSKNGLVITEKNTYTEWLDTSSTRPERHGSSPEKPFRAKTETSYLLKEDGSIEVTDLKVNCPSNKLQPIFNPQSVSMMLQDFFAGIMSARQSTPDSESPAPSPRKLG